MSTFCLNMIVKNEAANLPRMLASVKDHISCYAILDTGSTDDTKKIIRETLSDKEGVIGDAEFINFSQARNAALDLARGFRAVGPAFDYFLLMDADMELVVDAPPPKLGHAAYALVQKAGSLSYHNVRMLKWNAEAKYLGATHEYLSVDECGQLSEWWFKDHATGSNRPNKIKRDIKLLTDELKAEPHNPRTMFYLANSLMEDGNHQRAITMYERHRTVSTWDEERYYSLLQIGRCYKALGQPKQAIRMWQDAYNERPQRQEAAYEIARLCRERSENALSLVFADAGLKTPPCGDLLFVDTTPARWGFAEETAISGFYVPHRRADGFRAANKLALQLDAPPETREKARQNLMFYIQPIGTVAKSWRSRPLMFLPPKDKYTAMNPSIAVVDGKIVALARTVNYVIRPDGSYDMQGDDAIRTTNYLVPLNDDLTPGGDVVEILRPEGLPAPVFPPVQGFEDMRLIPTKTGLFTSATVREQNTDGVCEQWLSNVEPDGRVTHSCKMLTPERYGHQYEKNWMPVIDRRNILFMYRPGAVVNPTGDIIYDNQPTIAVDKLSGGSQLIFWEGGWIGLVHEAYMDPAHGYSKRYYQHRAVWYDDDFVLRKVSMPFWFEQRQIEFCAGLCRHPRQNEFLISYSTNDAIAKIGSISDNDMRDLLWAM